MFSRILNRERLILFIILIIKFPLILFGTGTITSGWHLIDGGEIVTFTKEYVENNVPFWDAFSAFLKVDLDLRFRPMHCFVRMTTAYVFGLNSVIPNVLLCIMGMCTYLLLYGVARKMDCSILNTHLFALIVVLGRQYEIWYRMANQENTGLFLLVGCLWIIVFEYRRGFSDKVCKRLDCLLTILLISCGLMKESFMLLLPGVILLRLALEGICNEIKLIQWWKMIHKHIVMCGITAGVFICSGYYIIKNIGVNSIGYAGIDEQAGLWGIVWGIGRMLKDSLLCYTILGVVICFVFAIAIRNKVVNRKLSPAMVL